ncbi:DNA internalization-related competence protein ComEC/Rec2 [Marinobacter alexandrii]|uniref:DNA internalization-related competence protein ComEC/Rec2 n=1 Tax=Marinobacter alexandrii TaxID=2570351 RepID=UPI003D6624C4
MLPVDHQTGGQGLSGNSITRLGAASGRGLAVAGAFAFSCGVILLYWLSMLPPPLWIVASFIGAFCIALRTRQFPLRRMALLSMALIMGLAWASWHADRRLTEGLPADMEGQRLSVSGYVCDIPSPGSFNSLRFSFCVTRWHERTHSSNQTVKLPQLLRLAWYGKSERRLPSHRLRLELVLKRPHGTLNDAGFRYEDWLFRKGYRATGTVRNAVADHTVDCGLKCRYHEAHGWIAGWVERRFASAEHRSLISSLLVGDRGHLTPSHWQVLQATGTIHLVAISGLHLGLIALGAGFLVRRFLLVLPLTWIGEVAQRRCLFSAVMTCCLVYALMAGFTVPTQRALLMVAVGGWSLLFARQLPAWQAWVWALAAVLLLDPFAPLDQGFWLSFGAVAVLIWVFAAGFRPPGWLRTLLLAQGALFAGLWPLLQVYGQDQPLIGGLANLLAIPWVSLVVMPGLIAGALAVAILPAGSEAVVQLCDVLMGTLWAVLARLAEFSSPVIEVGQWEVIGLAGLVLLLVKVPTPGGGACAGLLFMVWLAMGQSPTSQRPNTHLFEPEVTVWDVGQGLAVLVRHQGRVFLYDTGPGVPGVFSAVESTLLPNLKALGVHRIDTLVISHADSDHSGGLATLAGSIEIGKLVTGEVLAVREKLGQESDLVVQSCAVAEEELGGLRIHYWQAGGSRTGNDASCVVRIEHPPSRTEWLLPGDISAATEAHYLSHLRGHGALAADVSRLVVAPHHGSKTSSSPQWVTALTPEVVIYSAGYRHRYRHPHSSVTARYRDLGVSAFSTACSGMLVAAVEDNHLTIKEKRLDAPFWIGAPGQARDECAIP